MPSFLSCSSTWRRSAPMPSQGRSRQASVVKSLALVTPVSRSSCNDAMALSCRLRFIEPTWLYLMVKALLLVSSSPSYPRRRGLCLPSAHSSCRCHWSCLAIADRGLHHDDAVRPDGRAGPLRTVSRTRPASQPSGSRPAGRDEFVAGEDVAGGDDVGARPASRQSRPPRAPARCRRRCPTAPGPVSEQPSQPARRHPGEVERCRAGPADAGGLGPHLRQFGRNST